MKNSTKLIKYMQERGVKKGWIASYLGISRPTLRTRLDENSFTVDDIAKLKELGAI